MSKFFLIIRDSVDHHFCFNILQFWVDAMSEVFIVGMVGLGVFSSLSSYNKFHNNFCL